MRWGVASQLKVQLFIIGNRFAAVCRANVKHVNQHFCPFNVAQKLMSEPRALMRALYQSRNVGEDKILLAIDADNA